MSTRAMAAGASAEVSGGCAVCGADDPAASPGGMSRVVIEGRALSLCRAHAATVVTEMPATFDEMRALFVAGGRDPLEERRSPISRRSEEDRRVFPPRLEGRRMSNGRRNTDPAD